MTLILVSPKSHLRPVLYPIVKLFAKTDDICPLESYHPDGRNSCVCENEISYTYDLHIIVPVYKVEKYIESCMDSIVGQKTKYSYIVTVINDGSPDGSRQKLKRYENLPQVEIIDQENKGFSGARNTGLKHIKGRYVMFVDSDDILLDGAIEQMVATADTNEADIVQGGWYSFSDDKVFPSVSFPDGEATKSLQGFPWGKIYKAELFRKVCFPKDYWFEDTLISTIIMRMATRIFTSSAVVYGYRQHGASITATCGGAIKTLDTLYVTRSLLYDMRILGLQITQSCYEKYLRQVKCNFLRTISLLPVTLWYSVFIEHVRLLKEFFPNFHTEVAEYKELDRALHSNNYHQYLKSFM